MRILFRCIFMLAVIVASIIIVFVFMADNQFVRNKRQSQYVHQIKTKQKIEAHNIVRFEDVLKYGRNFNMSGEDLLILLHIQKTGGTTFERHLVHGLVIDNPCICSDDKRRCSCPRPGGKREPKTYVEATWLISRFSTGWVCGLHPDWTQLNQCLQRLRHLYFVTFLRHPLFRFISEFRHVQRGATWKTSKNHCRQYNTQLCFANRSSWQNVSLEEFIGCKYNMAINRQTRMLSDHNQLGCPTREEDEESATRNEIMLSSAMSNLKEMVFFGLCEEQRVSQEMFERTFNVQFKEDFVQSEDNKTRVLVEKLSPTLRKSILSLNHLDMRLYHYAKDLFLERCRLLGGSCKVLNRNK